MTWGSGKGDKCLVRRVRKHRCRFGLMLPGALSLPGAQECYFLLCRPLSPKKLPSFLFSADSPSPPHINAQDKRTDWLHRERGLSRAQV